MASSFTAFVLLLFLGKVMLILILIIPHPRQARYIPSISFAIASYQ